MKTMMVLSLLLLVISVPMAASNLDGFEAQSGQARPSGSIKPRPQPSVSCQPRVETLHFHASPLYSPLTYF
jgi:hypothetical protein